MVRFFLGDAPARHFKRVRPLIEKINQWDSTYEEYTVEQMSGLTALFRERLDKGEQLDDLLPEAFGAAKQACRRLCGQSWEAGGAEQEWNMVPYDVQLCGGISLHRGAIAEMATGEGKTLVAVAPLYLNALEGHGTHLVTVNDYLARRDSEWMGRVFETLGMSVGCILTDMSPEQRREAYACDVTYGTNNEFGFDYLRDNMAWHPDQLVQRDYHYAIVDEVDSVLIDEARTPLIISGQVDRSTQMFDQIKPLINKLVQRQNELINDIVSEAEELIKEADELEEGKELEAKRYEAGVMFLQARKGYPKHKRLMKVSSDGGILRLIEKVEHEFMRDKRMPELESELFFVVDERGHTIDLTDKGRTTVNPENPDLYLLPDIVEEVAAIEQQNDLSEQEREDQVEEAHRQHDERSELLHNISQMLRAYILYVKDDEYIVEDNKVVIIDENTGRKMGGRRWSDGLHQAVEAKEGVKIEKETQTLATITLQNYFRMYRKLAGMTGTAETEASEFAHTYKMDVTVIPTNMPCTRDDMNDLIYKTQREKYSAILDEIRRLHELGLPILVGTTSVEVSEKLSKILKRMRISHNVLNAKQHEHEAQIVKDAGQMKAVTIATNMAGRGTDIKLGPGVLDEPPGWNDDPDNPARGLQIVGTERHESRRIDRQLMGRAGRQGDPGTSRFFVSIEDDLMRLFASEKMARLMSRGFVEGEPLSHGLANRAIASAQKKIEGINFEQRKRTLEYDNVMNKQRETIYGMRRESLVSKDDNIDQILSVAEQALVYVWQEYCSEPAESDWDVEGFLDWVRRCVMVINLDNLSEVHADSQEAFLREVLDRCEAAYHQKSEALGPEIMSVLQRVVILNVIDQHWRDHLLAIDELRQGIFLQSYGQKNPLTEYRSEASEMFMELQDFVAREIFEKIYRIHIVQERETGASSIQFSKETGRQAVADTVRGEQERQQQQAGSQTGQQQARRPATYRRAERKIKPNEPCPCGSGKKYKRCCGSVTDQARPVS
jgi:preprotein translocase subunit SecA